MPALAISPENHIYLVWQELNGTNTNLYGRKWSGAWEALPSFDAPSGTDQRIRPALTLTSSNTPLVASIYYNGAMGDLGSFFWLNSYYNTWSPQISIEQPSGVHNVGGIQIATVAAKNAEVLAYDVYSDAQSIRGIAVQRSHSPLLGGGVVTSPAKRTATQPSLALDGSDNPHIAWQECPDSSSQSGCVIYAAYWDGSWQMLGDTVSSGSTDGTAPSLIMGKDGHPVVAWSGFSSPERSIWVRRWTGSEWQSLGSPLSAASGISTAGFRPVLALDKNGRPLVAWHESDGSASSIHVYRYND